MHRLVLTAIAALVFVPSAAAWTWPTSGEVLRTFDFDRNHPYSAGQHRGIDLAGPAGSPVLAPVGGSVSFAGTVPTSGKTVTIQTQDGYSVTLVHLDSIGVARGANVAEGDTVGTIGPSGEPEVADPYVHLGVRVTADPQGYVDPLELLPARASGAAESSESEAAPVPAPDPVEGAGGEAAAATDAPDSVPADAEVVTDGSAVEAAESTEAADASASAGEPAAGDTSQADTGVEDIPVDPGTQAGEADGEVESAGAAGHSQDQEAEGEADAAADSDESATDLPAESVDAPESTELSAEDPAAIDESEEGSPVDPAGVETTGGKAQGPSAEGADSEAETDAVPLDAEAGDLEDHHPVDPASPGTHAGDLQAGSDGPESGELAQGEVAETTDLDQREWTELELAQAADGEGTDPVGTEVDVTGTDADVQPPVDGAGEALTDEALGRPGASGNASVAGDVERDGLETGVATTPTGRSSATTTSTGRSSVLRAGLRGYTRTHGVVEALPPRHVYVPVGPHADRLVSGGGADSPTPSMQTAGKAHQTTSGHGLERDRRSQASSADSLAATESLGTRRPRQRPGGNGFDVTWIALAAALLALGGGGAGLASARRRRPRPAPCVAGEAPAPAGSGTTARQADQSSASPPEVEKEAARIMSRVAESPAPEAPLAERRERTHPRRGRVAVCGRAAAHRPRGGLRPFGRLRPLSPPARKRRADGVGHGRARDARDGGRRRGRAVAA